MAVLVPVALVSIVPFGPETNALDLVDVSNTNGYTVAKLTVKVSLPSCRRFRVAIELGLKDAFRRGFFSPESGLRLVLFGMLGHEEKRV